MSIARRRDIAVSVTSFFFLMSPAELLATESILFNFPCYPQGSEPFSDVVFDKSGNLFGTTFSGGTVNIGSAYKLEAPGTGETNWMGTTIYSFGSQPQVPPLTDASNPRAGLLYEKKSGTFLGTGYYSNDSGCGGTGCGAIYTLTPPTGSSSVWTENAVYDFAGGADGANPGAPLTADIDGTFFGTTEAGGSGNAGTIFQLVPPAYEGAPWTETTLFAFHNGPDGGFPDGPVTFSSIGSLYGTTSYSSPGAGVVFELMPPDVVGETWTESVLYTFGLSGAPADGVQPEAGLVMDSSGNLYGTTLMGGLYGYGTVFELSPPAAGKTAWTYATIHSFANGTDGAEPAASLLLKPSGVLYGTTQGTGSNGSYGTVFKMTPPASGATVWKEKVLYNFTGKPDGEYPVSDVVSNSAGDLFGTTFAGGNSGCGAVFEVIP